MTIVRRSGLTSFPPPAPSAATKTTLVDAFGRRLDYLRVSVTDRCNLRCVYCLPHDAEFPMGDREFLNPKEFERLVGTLVAMGIRRVRLTGGEPLVRKDIVEIVQRLAALEGLEDLSLTTNGTELERMAPALRRAGLNRVNVSLDTADPKRFREITRRGDLRKVWRGVEAALATGLEPVKLNAVLLASHGAEELDRLVELAINYPLHVRFIEMMPTAVNEEIQRDEFRSADWAIAHIEERFGPLEAVEVHQRTGPAKLYSLSGGLGRIGFITPLSHTFCQECNRLRLTARGELRLCLFADRVFPLRHLIHASEERLRREVSDILEKKPEEHLLRVGDYGNLESFVQIGG